VTGHARVLGSLAVLPRVVAWRSPAQGLLQRAS